LQKNLTEFGVTDLRQYTVVLLVSWHQGGYAWDTSFLGNHYAKSKGTREEFAEFLKKIIKKAPNVSFEIWIKPISERDCWEEVVDIVKSVGGKVKIDLE